ncbi:hypothetical protein UNDKW_5017 [Undibacterium sp. KW1]|nr:hypothetical protein UNDKW_5017 [Undibacterium sp. KW1]
MALLLQYAIPQHAGEPGRQRQLMGKLQRQYQLILRRGIVADAQCAVKSWWIAETISTAWAGTGGRQGQGTLQASGLPGLEIAGMACVANHFAAIHAAQGAGIWYQGSQASFPGHFEFVCDHERMSVYKRVNCQLKE